MQHQQNLPGNESDALKETYEAILGELTRFQRFQSLISFAGLIRDVDSILTNLRLDTDLKRPDILPAIPQAILPLLRRVVEQCQAFGIMLHVPVQGKIEGGKLDQAGNKSRRDTLSDSESAATGSTGRQNMLRNLNEAGESVGSSCLQHL